MSTVSFDPFSVTLCLASCYHFRLLCPLMAPPPKATRPDEKFKTVMNRQALNNPLCWAFRNISPPLHWRWGCNEVPESCFLQCSGCSNNNSSSSRPPVIPDCTTSTTPDRVQVVQAACGEPPARPELWPRCSLPITFTYQAPEVEEPHRWAGFAGVFFFLCRAAFST